MILFECRNPGLELWQNSFAKCCSNLRYLQKTKIGIFCHITLHSLESTFSKSTKTNNHSCQCSTGRGIRTNNSGLIPGLVSFQPFPASPTKHQTSYQIVKYSKLNIHLVEEVLVGVKHWGRHTVHERGGGRNLTGKTRKEQHGRNNQERKSKCTYPRTQETEPLRNSV